MPPPARVGCIKGRMRSSFVGNFCCCICCIAIVTIITTSSTCRAFAPRRPLSSRPPSHFRPSSRGSDRRPMENVIVSMSIDSDDYFSRRARDWDDQRTGVGRSVYSYPIPEYEAGGRQQRRQQPDQTLMNEDYYDRNNGDGREWRVERDDSSWTASQRQQRAYRKRKFTRDSQWPQSQRRDESYKRRIKGNFGGENYYYRRQQNQIMGNAGRRAGDGLEEFRGRAASARGGGRTAKDAAAANAAVVDAGWNGNYYYNTPPPSPQEYGRQIGFGERRQEYDIQNRYDPRERWGQQQRYGANYYDDSPYGDRYASDGWPLRELDRDGDGQQKYRRPRFTKMKEDNIFSQEAKQYDRGSNANEPQFRQKDLDPYYSDGPQSSQYQEQYLDSSPVYSAGRRPPRDTKRINENYPPSQPPLSPDSFRSYGDYRPNRTKQRSQEYYGSIPTKETEYYNIPGDRVPVIKMAKDERMEAKPTGIGYGGIEKFMNRFLYPFVTGSKNKEDGRFSLEMKKALAKEQRTIEALVKEARDYILSDPEVRDALGDSMSLGVPFSRSSFSNNKSIDGATTSYRLRLGIPITTGSDKVTGGLWLSADENGITRLEVIAGGREMDVRIDKPLRRDVVDANVTNKNIYNN